MGNNIKPVPIGMPVEWCCKMIVVPKKNGWIHRTTDLQQLNAQCQHETYHCQSPFKLACQVPPNMEKTILDAVAGHHAIPLDETSKPLSQHWSVSGADTAAFNNHKDKLQSGITIHGHKTNLSHISRENQVC